MVVSVGSLKAYKENGYSVLNNNPPALVGGCVIFILGGELMSDTISRQMALDALEKAIREDPYYDSNAPLNGLGVCDVRVILNDLPSMQPDTRLAEIADLVDGTIDHFDLVDAMDLLYQIKNVLKGR